MARGIVVAKHLHPGCINGQRILSTLSGGPNDIWIFQVAGTLTMSSAMKITLSGGAQAKNIFWQVAGAVTLGTTSHFEGIILGQTGINLKTGAPINGRMLAQTAVTLEKNTVTRP
ncbi:MAG: ice-binding family protein [Ferruginibacter sp.]